MGQFKIAPKGELLAMIWKDRKVLRMLSTADINYVTMVPRKQKDGTRQDVQCPTNVDFARSRLHICGMLYTPLEISKIKIFINSTIL